MLAWTFNKVALDSVVRGENVFESEKYENVNEYKHCDDLNATNKSKYEWKNKSFKEWIVRWEK